MYHSTAWSGRSRSHLRNQDKVNSVYASGSNIFAGTGSGLAISTNGGTSFTTYTTANGLGADSVNDVHASDNTIYAATAGGLSISTDGGSSFTTYTSADGLGTDAVYGVFASGSNIYAATFGGLSIGQASPPSAVPAPLPLLGAGAAYSWSRRLRRRLG